MIIKFIRKYLIPYLFTLFFLSVLGLLFLDKIGLPFYVSSDELYLPDVRGESLYVGRKILNENTDIAKKIFNSCVNFPEITGGTNSVNCILTKLSKKKIFFKNGAEGVFLALIPEIKSALVVKILDGAGRAAETAIAGLISELNVIDENELAKIKFREVTNSVGQKIGKMKFVL